MASPHTGRESGKPGKGKMTVQQAGHLGGEKGGQKGGERVKELVEEGKRVEGKEGEKRKGGAGKPRH